MSEGENHERLAESLGARSKGAGRTPATAHVRLPPARGETTVEVAGYWLDDEPSTVEVVVSGPDRAETRLSFVPGDARAFAEDVLEAAAFAEEGEDV